MAALLERVKAMKCKELGEMISKKLDDPEYESDVLKLIAQKIDGKLFLDLTKDDLTEFGLSFGGKKKILSMVKEIKDGNFEWPQAQAEDMLDDFLWCSTIPPDDIIEIDPPASLEGDALAGFMRKIDEWAWQKYPKLLVKFMNEVPRGWTVGNGHQMNKENILAWANIWHHKGGENIPCFEEAKPGEEAQIRIKFNNKGVVNSHVGKSSQGIPEADPTMNLDLHKGGSIDEDRKKRHVIHEFGHALGLRHEHQRPDFWACIKPYLDVDKMKGDVRAVLKHLSPEEFDTYWNTNFNIHGQVSPTTHYYTQYDSESIMHYPLLRSWLKPPYDDKSKVETDCGLKPDVAAALLGFHKRHGSITYKPSPLDIDTLKKAYAKKAVTDCDDLLALAGNSGSTSGNEVKSNGRVSGGQNEPMSIASSVQDITDSNTDFVDTPKQNQTAAAQPMTKQEYNVEVTGAYLSRMVWIKNGREEVVNIYDESQYEWLKIGQTLGLKKGVLEGIGRNGLNDRDRVIKVLGKWEENARQLPHADRYPKTWRGLINLLNDSGLAELADEVHQALLQQKQPRQSSASGPVPQPDSFMQQSSNPGNAGADAPALIQPGNTVRQDVAMTGPYLTIDDLAEVNEAVLDAEAKWDFIGLQLGIGPGRTDAIKAKHQGNTTSCLKDVLTEFLQQVDPEPSWKRLADAMASKGVGRGDIAKKLRQK